MARKKNIFWEILNGVGVDGVRVVFPFFYAFFPFFYAFFPFFSTFLYFSSRTGAKNSNLLQKWGISLRPRLHRPRAKLPEYFRCCFAPPSGEIVKAIHFFQSI